MRNRSNLIFVILVSVALLAAGCGETITPTPRPTVTPTPTPALAGDPVLYNGEATPTPTATPTPVVSGLPDIATVVEQVAPAVVSVLATVEVRNFFGQIVEQTSQGSGVIFDERGYILTNNHVIEGARQVRVTLNDRTRHTAEIVGTDRDSDLAVLRINPDNVRDLVTVPLGNTESMRIGEWVIAIGNPLGLAGSVTVGVVSAKERQLTIPGTATTLYDLVQTDAIINPGNSGGPLLNLRGEVIGINTAIIRGQLGASGQQAEGIGFAVSMSTAVPVARQLIESGRVQRARLGISVDTVTPVMAEERDLSIDRGVLVVSVMEGGGAAQAGMEEGDIIVRVDGRNIGTFTELQRLLLAQYRPGDRISVTVVRDAVHLTFNVTLGT